VDIKKYKDKILKIILNKINKDECIIFLFGSYANNTYNRGSDIDIGILYNQKIKDIEFLEIKEELNNEFLVDIDLIDFNEVSKNVRDGILNKEIKIWHIGKNCNELLKNLKKHIKN